MTTTIHISGLNTEPAPLIHPASDSRYRAYPRISLLTCWLSSSQVGLGPLRPSPTGQKYRISWAPAQSHRPGFILARAATCYVPLSQSESLFLMRVRRSVSMFPIVPRRTFLSTTASRLILITLGVFKPDSLKSASSSLMTSSNVKICCDNCDDIMQISQSSYGPGNLRRTRAGRSLPRVWLV